MVDAGAMQSAEELAESIMDDVDFVFIPPEDVVEVQDEAA